MASFKTTYRVTWSDTDTAQVVHHSNYFRLFERAEEEFYEHLGINFGYSIEGDFWLPRIEVFCRYLAPSRFGDILEISLMVENVKEKSVKYRFTVRKREPNTLIAEGYIVAVASDKKLGKAIKIPQQIREKLEQFKR